MFYTFEKIQTLQQLFNLIEHTHRSIFLTGKAGTGKTTFLTHFIKNTTKKCVVAAPTGIAAINAGGVTIHSLFGLPLTTFAPTFDPTGATNAINITQLLPHFRYRRDKLKLLRSLEVLVIDEVSMLRCDVLDMIDWALRTARRSQQKFGGVQLLLIGDLYQLPPVVKEDVEATLYHYYASAFFFDAVALREMPLLTVALKKVYRQADGVFLQMLNAIRNNDWEAIDFELLNSRYQPQFQPREGYVYLVSHNYMANAINQQNLLALSTPSFTYRAVIEGDFKEHLYPNEVTLILKVGAQVMFIRNDSSEAKRFFNGKLAVVTALSKEYVQVLPDGETEALTILPEVWKNKKYYIDEAQKIQEDEIGSYEQYPFRLAWAVTIHKSQGLTFDRLIIDAGQSFTSGQVYVALSRCRTLEGIVLKSKITTRILFSDERIAAFYKKAATMEAMEYIVANEKYPYAISRLIQLLEPHWLQKEINNWSEEAATSRVLKNEETVALSRQLISEAEKLVLVFGKFDAFIKTKMQHYTTTQEGWPTIEAKAAGAVNYFFSTIKNKFFDPLKEAYALTKGEKGVKGYNEVLKGLLEELEMYLAQLKTAQLVDKNLYQPQPDDTLSLKIEKKPSHLISFEMLEAGKSVAAIASERNITEGTVLGHLAKMASVGVLNIEQLFHSNTIAIFKQQFDAHHFEGLNEWKAVLPDSFDFNEIRVLLHHFRYWRNREGV